MTWEKSHSCVWVDGNEQSDEMNTSLVSHSIPALCRCRWHWHMGCSAHCKCWSAEKKTALLHVAMCAMMQQGCVLISLSCVRMEHDVRKVLVNR